MSTKILVNQDLGLWLTSIHRPMHKSFINYLYKINFIYCFSMLLKESNSSSPYCSTRASKIKSIDKPYFDYSFYGTSVMFLQPSQNPLVSSSQLLFDNCNPLFTTSQGLVSCKGSGPSCNPLGCGTTHIFLARDFSLAHKRFFM